MRHGVMRLASQPEPGECGPHRGHARQCDKPRQGGELIGLCGLMHVPFEAFFTPAVEISWRLSAKWQGQGLAKEVAQTVLNWAFESLKLDRVVAFTVTGNAPSWGLMERLGMRKIGEFDNPNFRKSTGCVATWSMRSAEPNGVQHREGLAVAWVGSKPRVPMLRPPPNEVR